MNINSLTTSEENLMMIIWQLNTPFMRDIMEAYPEPKPHQNTISTYLKILVDKNFLKTEKKGRIFQYHPIVSLDSYKDYVLQIFLENYFHNSPEQLFRTMIDKNIITTEQLKTLIETQDDTQTQLKVKNKKDIEISNFVAELTDNQKKSKKKKKKKK